MRELTLAEVAVDGANKIDLKHQFLLAHITQCFCRLPTRQIRADHGKAGVCFTLRCQSLTLPHHAGLGVLVRDVLPPNMIHLL